MSLAACLSTSYYPKVHTPHRAALALPLLIIALVLAGCTGGVAKPEGWASPVFDNGVTYAFQKKDSLTAINADGNVSWTFPDKNKEPQKDIKIGAVYGTPKLVDGILYFATYEGDALAVKADTGDMVWRNDTNESIVGDVAVADGRVAFGTTEGRLFVLDAATGAPASGWPTKGVNVDKPIWAPVIADGKFIFMATMRGTVRKYDLETANEEWVKEVADGAIADLALVNDWLAVPSLDKRVYLLNKGSGDTEKVAHLKDWAWGVPAVRDTTLVLADISGHVYGFDLSGNGDLAQSWEYSTDHRLKASPTIVDSVAVVADRSPEVHFVDASNGTFLNAVPLTDVGTIRANPVVKDGLVYFLTTKGHLMKADPDKKTVVEETIGRYQP